MNNLDLAILSESIDIGETLRIDCECGGKKTLTLTRLDDGAVVYNCFRASCPLKPGVIGRTHYTGSSKPDAPRRRIWEGPTEPLPKRVRQWILQKWGITDPPHWYYTDDFGGRIAMSVRSPTDSHRGWVLRADELVVPKALTYLDEGATQASWYLDSTRQLATVVVEDIPSAVRASTYVNAVSLLGTILNDDKAIELQRYAPKPIILAFDQDATLKAMAYKKKYALILGDVRVLPLRQDLKDMQEEELCSLLQRYTAPSSNTRTKKIT